MAKETSTVTKAVFIIAGLYLLLFAFFSTNIFLSDEHRPKYMSIEEWEKGKKIGWIMVGLGIILLLTGKFKK